MDITCKNPLRKNFKKSDLTIVKMLIPCLNVINSKYFSSKLHLQVYTNLEGNRANLVQTAWALLSLIDAGQVSLKY